MAQPELVEHSWLMYSFTAFLNSSLVGNNGFVQPEVTATEGLMLGKLLGLLDGSEDSWMVFNGLLLGKLLGLIDGSEDSWMAVLVMSLGLLDGFVDGFFDEVLLGAGVGEWHEAKHESRKSCCS
jgi:hypothetical protein